MDRAIAPHLLPRLGAALRERHVELRVDPEAREILGYGTPATEEDWATEFLDLILAVRVVDGLDEALDHIARYGSSHSEAILPRDDTAARRDWGHAPTYDLRTAFGDYLIPTIRKRYA